MTTSTKKPIWRKGTFWILLFSSFLVAAVVAPRNKNANRAGRETHTKNAWKMKVAAHFGYAGNHLQASSGDFVAIMGKPDRQQTIGGNYYWYYHCDDGRIQLVMEIDPQSGMLVAEVNDY